MICILQFNPSYSAPVCHSIDKCLRITAAPLRSILYSWEKLWAEPVFANKTGVWAPFQCFWIHIWAVWITDACLKISLMWCIKIETERTFRKWSNARQNQNISMDRKEWQITRQIASQNWLVFNEMTELNWKKGNLCMEYDTKAIKCYHERALIQIRQKKNTAKTTRSRVYIFSQNTHTHNLSVCLSLSLRTIWFIAKFMYRVRNGARSLVYRWYTS